jgi:hypothetical protein
VKADPADPNPPSPGVGRVNVYGFSQLATIPNPGWAREAICLVEAVNGQGEVRGLIVRRVRAGDPVSRVVGATVRLGCSVTSSDSDGYRFAPTKAGRYLLKASMFVIDPDTNVGTEWKSKEVDLTIKNGDMLSGVDLELFPPPGLLRNLVVEHHADVIDRKVFGKDDIGHFDLNQPLLLAFDPRDDPALPVEEQNTKLTNKYDKTTPPVGDTHINVIVDARLHGVPGAGGSVHFDGSVDFDLHLVFYEDGEIFNTFDDPGKHLFPTDMPYVLPYNFVDFDVSPDRASGTITIRNTVGVLP